MALAKHHGINRAVGEGRRRPPQTPVGLPGFFHVRIFLGCTTQLCHLFFIVVLQSTTQYGNICLREVPEATKQRDMNCFVYLYDMMPHDSNIVSRYIQLTLGGNESGGGKVADCFQQLQ